MTTSTWTAIDMFTGEIVTDSVISRVVLAHREIVNDLAALCEMLPPLGADGQRCWNRMTKAERGILNRCAKQLHEAQATHDEIERFADWWYTQDWRGKEKRQLPGPWDVIKNWSRYLNWSEGTQENTVANEWLKVIKHEESNID
jgi:hypothetical protein